MKLIFSMLWVALDLLAMGKSLERGLIDWKWQRGHGWWGKDGGWALMVGGDLVGNGFLFLFPD